MKRNEFLIIITVLVCGFVFLNYHEINSLIQKKIPQIANKKIKKTSSKHSRPVETVKKENEKNDLLPVSKSKLPIKQTIIKKKEVIPEDKPIANDVLKKNNEDDRFKNFNNDHNDLKKNNEDNNFQSSNNNDNLKNDYPQPSYDEQKEESKKEKDNQQSIIGNFFILFGYAIYWSLKTVFDILTFTIDFLLKIFISLFTGFIGAIFGPIFFLLILYLVRLYCFPYCQPTLIKFRDYLLKKIFGINYVLVAPAALILNFIFNINENNNIFNIFNINENNNNQNNNNGGNNQNN